MPVTIKKLTADDFRPVARFIAMMNSRKEHNFTDLGINPDEIEYFIKDDLLDMPATEGFHLAYENDNLIAVWGLDYDNEKGYMYSLGPFIKHDNWHEIAEMLWGEVEKTLPSSITCMMMSMNALNTNGIEFAGKHGFKPLGTAGLILQLKQSEFIPCEHSHIVELTGEYEDDFRDLHDRTFPGTYYSGEDIIGRCNDIRKVFVNNPVSGYIYVEPQPEFGVANLEFIGVHPDSRGSGLGQALLSKGIEYVFSFDKINEINLTVYEDNPARRLYERVGFKISDRISGYEREFK